MHSSSRWGGSVRGASSSTRPRSTSSTRSPPIPCARWHRWFVCAGRFRARGVIIDATAIDVIDSFATDTLREMAQMVRLRGAETVIVGIQPDVAFAMVHMGLSLEGVTTVLDLEEGLAYLDRRNRSLEPG